MGWSKNRRGEKSNCNSRANTGNLTKIITFLLEQEDSCIRKEIEEGIGKNVYVTDALCWLKGNGIIEKRRKNVIKGRGEITTWAYKISLRYKKYLEEMKGGIKENGKI